MQFEGKILAVMPLQQGISAGTGQRWCNREFVVCDDSREYDETVVFRLRGEKAEQFSCLLGEKVRIQFGFRAHQMKDNPDKWFNEVVCFKIDSLSPTDPRRE